MAYEPEPVDEVCAVCGAEVDARQAADLGLVAEYAGRSYLFCGETHRRAFLADPALSARPEEPKTV